jgi:pyrroloquinoline quinone biosynthesis protein E
MSDVLPTIPPDASDSLAVLEKTRSTAETFGIPLAVLLEITHRCPTNGRRC